MANKKHLQILKQGTESWNRWRKKNPKIQPNLDMANLRRAQLGLANLDMADLSGADLRRAKLRKANLRGTILIETNVQEALKVPARVWI